MEGNSYIIPPSMEDNRCIKILPQDNKHDQPRRCGCKTSPQDLEQAQRLSSELMGQTDKASTMERIILLRVCKNGHRMTLKQSGNLGKLIEAYKKTYVETDNPKLPFAQRNERLFERYHPTGRGTTVSDILPQAINQQQDAQGSIYIFNWPREPGFLKIGYAKGPAEKRVNTWQRCHPEATPLHEVELAFPERMEKLIHAELAGKRYCLRECCSRCGRKHTEWFAVALEEALRIVRDWREIAASRLYTEDRILSREWSRIVGSLSQITASTLSQHLKKSPCSDMSKACSISEQPETSSPRKLSQRENLHTSLASPLFQEDRQIDELVANLDRDLTIS